NFYFIPKHFFTPEIIKKRKPLSQSARRAGWIGCNIQVSGIPKAGKIPIIENGMIQDKAKIIEKVSAADALNLSNMESRGWLYDVMSCIDKIDSRDFTLKEMYQFEAVLFQKHPNNHNIQAKIRQQLQLLRDKGFIEFTGRGEYRKVL
ncbi:MAG: restriction endonuclease, partial [Eubacteriaceae bacterium]|nr:restriction endonuclease [Eubacteriaceae bacterium]